MRTRVSHLYTFLKQRQYTSARPRFLSRSPAISHATVSPSFPERLRPSSFSIPPFLPYMPMKCISLRPRNERKIDLRKKNHLQSFSSEGGAHYAFIRIDFTAQCGFAARPPWRCPPTFVGSPGADAAGPRGRGAGGGCTRWRPCACSSSSCRGARPPWAWSRTPWASSAAPAGPARPCAGPAAGTASVSEGGGGDAAGVAAASRGAGRSCTFARAGIARGAPSKAAGAGAGRACSAVWKRLR